MSEFVVCKHTHMCSYNSYCKIKASVCWSLFPCVVGRCSIDSSRGWGGLEWPAPWPVTDTEGLRPPFPGKSSVNQAWVTCCLSGKPELSGRFTRKKSWFVRGVGLWRWIYRDIWINQFPGTEEPSQFWEAIRERAAGVTLRAKGRDSDLVLRVVAWVLKGQKTGK